MGSKTRRRRGLLGKKGQSPLGLPVHPALKDAAPATPPEEEETEAVLETVMGGPPPDLSDEVQPPAEGTPAHDFYSADSSAGDSFDPVVEDGPSVPLEEDGPAPTTPDGSTAPVDEEAPVEDGLDDNRDADLIDPLDAIIGTEVHEDAARTDSGYYVETGEMPSDTQELGWSSDVFGRDDTGPPTSDRVTSATHTDIGRSLAAELFSEPESSDISDDLTDPPTEEVPAPLARHISGTSRDTASMDLPEPPPLPGIMDRYTPAPIQERSEITSRLRRDATFEPDQPARSADSERSFRKASAPVPPPIEAAEPATGMFIAAAGVGALVAVLLILIWQFVSGSFRAEAPAPPPEAKVPVLVEPQPVTQPIVAPEPSAEEAAEEEAAEEEAAEEEAAEEEAAEEEEVEAPAEEAAPAEPAPTTSRVILNNPAERETKPVAKPKSEPPKKSDVWGGASSGSSEDAGGTGTLRIRTNVRALVQVDGGPQQYASRPLELSAGTHEIKAFRPGRMDTAQTKTIDVVAGEVVTVQFSF